MPKSEIEELRKLVLAQGRKISKLEKQYKEISASSKTQEFYADSKEEEETKEKEFFEDKPSEEKTTFNLFKLFGIGGMILIVLGVIYFYKYAVDQGWIGIQGRIALGILAGVLVLGIGIFLTNKYEKFPQLLIGLGLAIVYYTLYATYHFLAYRTALGMTLTLNTILLLGVMLAGLIIGLRLDRSTIIYGSLLLGYISAFLSGINGDTLHILIYVLLMNIVIVVVAYKRPMYVGIPAQILSYIAFGIWFIQAVVSPNSILNQTSSPFLITFLMLFIYYALFTLLSFIQSIESREANGIALASINTVAATLYGLLIINEYYPEANGIYLMGLAGVSVLLTFISKNNNYSNLRDIYYLLTFILIAIAIPVQFDNTIVTLLWVLMALLLAYAGLKTDYERLFYVGFIGFAIPFGRALFYDLWALQGVDRILAVGSVVAGMIIIQVLIARSVSFERASSVSYYNIYPIAGSILLTFWSAVEVYATNLGADMQNITLSIVWALLALIMIGYGLSFKRKVYNWCGIILFIIVVIKILLFDLSRLDNIFRVGVLIIVGVLAILISFVYVKNKDKIGEFI